MPGNISIRCSGLPLCEPDDAGAGRLTAEVARGLALWMSFEDTIRVADLKTRADRKRRVLAPPRHFPANWSRSWNS